MSSVCLLRQNLNGDDATLLHDAFQLCTVLRRIYEDSCARFLIAFSELGFHIFQGTAHGNARDVQAIVLQKDSHDQILTVL